MNFRYKIKVIANSILVKKYLKQILIISIITILLFEFFSFLLIKLKFVKNTLPSWVTLHASEEYSHWHPKSITFKNISAQCWSSTVSYNNFGMRGVGKVSLKKKKKRIALLGDSMIENIELSDGLDIGSKTQKKLPNYEILNFSARATGLADQIDIYNKLIKKFNVDHVFLFVHYNDFINNSINGNPKIYHRRYDYIDGKIIEIEKDYEWLRKYNSPIKYTIRNYTVHLKNTNSYMVYLHMLGLFKNKTNKEKQSSNFTNTQHDLEKQYINKYINYFDKNKKIYNFLKKKFILDFEKNKNLHVVLNIFPFNFVNEDNLTDEEKFIKNNVMPYLEKTWSNVDFVYPVHSAKEYISKNKLKYPYFSWNCDKHYNINGSEFISNLIYEKVNNLN